MAVHSSFSVWELMPMPVAFWDTSEQRLLQKTSWNRGEWSVLLAQAQSALYILSGLIHLRCKKSPFALIWNIIGPDLWTVDDGVRGRSRNPSVTRQSPRNVLNFHITHTWAVKDRGGKFRTTQMIGKFNRNAFRLLFSKGAVLACLMCRKSSEPERETDNKRRRYRETHTEILPLHRHISERLASPLPWETVLFLCWLAMSGILSTTQSNVNHTHFLVRWQTNMRYGE